jgi:hypothetical protein
MEQLFSQDYWPMWALVLGLALFFPVRQLIWVIYVRRAERDGNKDEARRQSLRRRAAFTALLVVMLFSLLYTQTLFKSP